MNPSSDVGRNEVSTRLTAQTQIVFLDYPSKDDMKIIVKSMVEGTLQRGSKVVQGIAKSKASLLDGLTGFLLDLYAFVKTTYTPESSKHYTFTPKDIGTILESSLCYEVETAEELSFAVLQESSLTFRARLVKTEEISKYDSA